MKIIDFLVFWIFWNFSLGWGSEVSSGHNFFSFFHFFKLTVDRKIWSKTRWSKFKVMPRRDPNANIWGGGGGVLETFHMVCQKKFQLRIKNILLRSEKKSENFLDFFLKMLIFPRRFQFWNSAFSKKNQEKFQIFFKFEKNIYFFGVEFFFDIPYGKLQAPPPLRHLFFPKFGTA